MNKFLSISLKRKAKSKWQQLRVLCLGRIWAVFNFQLYNIYIGGLGLKSQIALQLSDPALFLEEQREKGIFSFQECTPKVTSLTFYIRSQLCGHTLQKLPENCSLYSRWSVTHIKIGGSGSMGEESYLEVSAMREFSGCVVHILSRAKISQYFSGSCFLF